MAIRPGESACYRCAFPEPPPPGTAPTCAEAGVLGPAAGVIGSLQALEALKLLAGLDGALLDAFLQVDLTTTRSCACPSRAGRTARTAAHRRADEQPAGLPRSATVDLQGRRPAHTSPRSPSRADGRPSRPPSRPRPRSPDRPRCARTRERRLAGRLRARSTKLALQTASRGVACDGRRGSSRSSEPVRRLAADVRVAPTARSRASDRPRHPRRSDRPARSIEATRARRQRPASRPRSAPADDVRRHPRGRTRVTDDERDRRSRRAPARERRRRGPSGVGHGSTPERPTPRPSPHVADAELRRSARGSQPGSVAPTLPRGPTPRIEPVEASRCRAHVVGSAPPRRRPRERARPGQVDPAAHQRGFAPPRPPRPQTHDAHAARPRRRRRARGPTAGSRR